jgi:hypothetical protein
VRNAIARHVQAGTIAAEEPRAAGLARRLRPTPKLVATMKHNLAVRLAAIEPVIAWPKPAAEWAHTDRALDDFVRGNVEAYRRDRYALFQKFPEVRGFMDRHCGYHVPLDALARLETGAEGAKSCRSAKSPPASPFRARMCESCLPPPPRAAT